MANRIFFLSCVFYTIWSLTGIVPEKKTPRHECGETGFEKYGSILALHEIRSRNERKKEQVEASKNEPIVENTPPSRVFLSNIFSRNGIICIPLAKTMATPAMCLLLLRVL
jgi:hypothetical protein